MVYDKCLHPISSCFIFDPTKNKETALSVAKKGRYRSGSQKCKDYYLKSPLSVYSPPHSSVSPLHSLSSLPEFPHQDGKKKVIQWQNKTSHQLQNDESRWRNSFSICFEFIVGITDVCLAAIGVDQGADRLQE